MRMEEIRGYLQDVTESLARGFSTSESDVTVARPRRNKRAGYADCEIYSASVSAPDLEKLPKGYQDALTRLDTRFRIDTAFKFLNLEYPDLYREVRNRINAAAEENQGSRLSINEVFVKFDEERDAHKAYAESGGSDPVRQEKLRSDFHELNLKLQDIWEITRDFVADHGDDYRKDKKGRPVIKEMLRHIEESRPRERDTYDLFLQTLMKPEQGGQPFGIVLCDGISSHYMSANEARNIKRDSQNSFLDRAEAGIDRLFRMTKSVVCRLGHSFMGDEPKDTEEVREIVTGLVSNSFPDMDRKEVERLAGKVTGEDRSEEESAAFAPS